jgi:hypothetical protein
MSYGRRGKRSTSGLNGSSRCFQSLDPQIPLEPVLQGPVTETEVAAKAGVHETTKLVAARFKHQCEDA